MKFLRGVPRAGGREDEAGSMEDPTINDEERGASGGGNKTMSRRIRETGNSSVSWGYKQP